MFYCMHSPPICSSPRLCLKPSLKAPTFSFIVLDNLLLKKHHRYLLIIIFIFVIYQGKQTTQNSLIGIIFFEKIEKKT